MKIAITGATGFLGHALIGHLTNCRHQCIALTRDVARAKESASLPRGVEIRDISELSAIEADAVINLAGENPAGIWTPQKRRAILQSRVDCTRAAVAAMRSNRPKVFLSASAVGIYGDRPGETLTETSPLDPHTRFRAKVCREWEREANAAQTALGVRTVLLRIGNVMDLSGGFLAKLLPVYRMGGCFVFGDTNASVSWISLGDALRLITFAMENESISGPFNVVSPHPVTQGALTRGLTQRIGVKVRGRIPRWLLRATLGEFSRAIIDDQRVLPGKAQDAGFKFADPAWRSFLDATFG